MATASSATRKSADKPDAEAPAPKKKKRRALLYTVIALVVLLLGGGGGAAWLLMKPKAEAGGKAAAKHEPKKAEPAKPPVYVSLETFTVNLQPENGEHLLQTTFSLKVTDATIEEALKQRLPEVRSRLLLLLSSKKPSELVSTEGKQALANEIAAEVNKTLEAGAPGPVQSVYFTNFIVQ